MKEPREDVESLYDEISPFFSGKRQRVWPPISSFIDDISPCSLLDIGCGTGRVLIEAVGKGCSVTGLDISSGQLNSASKNIEDAGISKGYQLVKSSMESMPFGDGSFETACMIASLHHLRDRRSRIRALRESERVLVSGGRMQISVWTWDQPRFRERHLSRLGNERDLDELDGPLPGDFHVPWKEGKERIRFYHLYGPSELEEEVCETSLIIERSFFDGRNHWLEVIK